MVDTGKPVQSLNLVEANLTWTKPEFVTEPITTPPPVSSTPKMNPGTVEVEAVTENIIEAFEEPRPRRRLICQEEVCYF